MKTDIEMIAKSKVKLSLQNRIDKNRDEIENLLSKNIPLNVLYMRIRMLSAQNESLISKLKSL